MNRPSTAREALIAEALGEVAQLLDRVDSLTSEMNHARQSLGQASDRLADQLGSFERRMATITENAKTQAVQHIERRTEAVSRDTLDAQTRAMAAAARELFKAEVDPSLQRLVMPLQRLAQRLDRPWERWLMPAATALFASLMSLALGAYLWAP